MSNTMMTLKDFHDSHLKLGANDVILDVRNPNEFQEARIANAINIPVTEVAQHVDRLKKFDHVYIHCKRGGRAKSAFDILSSAGLSNLVCIFDAGMDAWIESGYKTIKD